MTVGKTLFAFQGVPGAFSHQAGQLFAGQLLGLGKAEFAPCETFAEVFAEVTSGRCRYGVLPLENSSIGSIVSNYDFLWGQPVVIIGEVVSPIHHHLLGLPGAGLPAIKEVYSHPAALEQCRKFLGQMGTMRPCAYFDTSGAAQYVQQRDDPTVAAIAGDLAARQYSLSILQANIEDFPLNQTRFGIIALTSGDVEMPDSLPAVPYKVSCAVELDHKSGSLARLLTRVASLEINLTKIESRPIPETPWHYRFFVDMELDGVDQDSSVIAVLKDSTEAYKVLGRYRAWQDT